MRLVLCMVAIVLIYLVWGLRDRIDVLERRMVEIKEIETEAFKDGYGLGKTLTGLPLWKDYPDKVAKHASIDSLALAFIDCTAPNRDGLFYCEAKKIWQRK